jgi:hypothetical protein
MKKRASSVQQHHYKVTITSPTQKRSQPPHERTIYDLVFATSEAAGARLLKDRYLTEGNVTITCINKETTNA